MADDIFNNNGDVVVANIRIRVSELKKDSAETQQIIANLAKSINTTVSSLANTIEKNRTKINELTNTIGNKSTTNGFLEFSKKTDSALSGLSKTFGNLGRTALKGFFTVVSGRFLGTYAKQFAAFAGDYIENLNLIENAYGRNSEKVAKWAQEFSRSLGVSINEVMKFAGSFQSLMETMVGTTEVGQQMSQVLTQLTYDIGSLRNMDFSEAYNKMQSTIFGGQLKTSRFLGVDISTNALDELLKDLGMVNVRARDLSEAEKVYLRFIKTVGSLEVSGAFGDLAETISSVSNRIRILKGSWENLMTSIGNATSGIISDLLATLIGIVKALTDAVQVFWKLPTKSGFNNAAAGIDLITESVEDLNESMGLLNIDKFNVLSQGETDRAGAGIKDELEGIAQEYVDRYNKIAEAFDRTDEAVEKIRLKILKWIFPNNTIEALQAFTKTGEEIDKTLRPSIQRLVNSIRKIFAYIREHQEEIFDAILQILDWIPDIIATVLNVLGIIKNVADAVGGIGNLIKIIINLVIGIKVVSFLSKVIGLVGKLYAGIDKLLGPLTGLKGLIVGIATYAATDFLINMFPEELRDEISTIAIVLGSVLGVIVALKAVATSGASLAKDIPLIAAAAGMAVAGIKNLVSSNKNSASSGGGGGHSFANSGIPDHGSLYWAGEGSRPEILYNAGGRTNVIDSEILGDQFYNAMVRANRTTGGSAGNGNMVAKLVINGKELADATFNDFDYYSRRTTGRGLISK